MNASMAGMETGPAPRVKPMAALSSHRKLQRQQNIGVPVSVDSVDSVDSGPSGDSVLSVNRERIVSEVQATLPDNPGGVGKSLFDLARRLRAIEGVDSMIADDLAPVVKYWHGQAGKKIGPFPLEEAKFSFEKAWGGVRFAAGTDQAVEAFEKARAGEPPACASQYDDPNMRILVGACWELQKMRGEQPFFLACRKAGECLGINYKRASVWLKILVCDGVLRVVGRASRRMASRYLFTGQQV